MSRSAAASIVSNRAWRSRSARTAARWLGRGRRPRWDGRDADLGDEEAAERAVVGEAQRVMSRHEEVRSLAGSGGSPASARNRPQAVAALGVFGGQLPVVAARPAGSSATAVASWNGRRGRECHPLVRGAQRRVQRRPARPRSRSSSRSREGFAGAVERQRALPHARQRRQRDMVVLVKTMRS